MVGLAQHTQLLGLVQKVVVVVATLFRVLSSFLSLLLLLLFWEKGVRALVRNNSTFSFPCLVVLKSGLENLSVCAFVVGGVALD